MITETPDYRQLSSSLMEITTQLQDACVALTPERDAELYWCVSLAEEQLRLAIECADRLLSMGAPPVENH